MSSTDDPTRMISPDEFGGIRGLAAGQKVFNRYRLESVAGRGGMGIVWRARDEELDRVVALKFLPEAVAADVEAVKDLKRETKRCLELTHPHIVRVYDFVQGPAGAAIAMEFVEGESLASVKAGHADGCLTVEYVAKFVGQLCSALDYAHFKAHLLHRDLKPANLIITKEGDLKVMDFGIACSLAETYTRLTARAGQNTSGTLLYMSPQQLMGEKPSVADDIYSLGATLYELLAGKPPFFRGDGNSLIMQVREKAPLSMTAQREELQIANVPIPPLWEEVILACLAKDPKDRPQSAGEVAERLSGVPKPPMPGSSRKVAATPPPPPPEAPPVPSETTRGAPGFRLVAIVVGLLTLATVAYYFLGRPGSRLAIASRNSYPETTTTPSPSDPVANPGSNPQVAPVEAETKKIPAAPGELRGGAIVRSEPAGAEVTVGALDRGTSPLTLREVKLGTYPVHVRLAGYEDWTGEVEVKANDFTEVSANLVRSVGTLVVTSEPAGLDAELTGRASASGPAPGGRQRIKTPEKLKLPTGTYDIVFHRSDWPDQKKTVEVTRNQLVETSGTFAAGKLVIVSEPVGAKVISEGKTIGITPLTLPEIPPGPQAVELRLAGYEPVKLNGVVATRAELRLSATLKVARMPEAGHATTLSDLDLELRYVAPETFAMGSPEAEPHRDSSEGPQTQVTFTQGYWLGKTEVTQRQYETLMGTNPSKFKVAGRDAPVENVSWTDAVEFCRRITAAERAAGRLPEGYTYTLPTEAQWEFACRAGTTTSYAGELRALAWFDKEGGKTTHPVATKTANAWGFHDLHGNVWEWCLDFYADHLPGGSVTDYAGPATGSRHVYRGGAWDSAEKECRSAMRVKGSAGDREDNVGFRLALSVAQTVAADAADAKPAHSGFLGGVKSAYGSVVKVFKPGDKPAVTDPDAGALTITIDKAPPAPLRFTLVLTPVEGAGGSVSFPLDEMVTKGRNASGAFVAKLSIPPGTYTFVVKAAGFQDVSEVAPRFVVGRKKDQLVVKAGSESLLEFELQPTKTE